MKFTDLLKYVLQICLTYLPLDPVVWKIYIYIYISILHHTIYYNAISRPLKKANKEIPTGQNNLIHWTRFLAFRWWSWKNWHVQQIHGCRFSPKIHLISPYFLGECLHRCGAYPPFLDDFPVFPHGSSAGSWAILALHRSCRLQATSTAASRSWMAYYYYLWWLILGKL